MLESTLKHFVDSHLYHNLPSFLSFHCICAGLQQQYVCYFRGSHILGTIVLDKVSITVPITTLTRSWSRHVDEISSCIAVAPNVTQIKLYMKSGAHLGVSANTFRDPFHQ